MSQPQFLISYKDLELRPCSPYKGLPKRGKFDVIAQIIRVRGYLYAPDLAWAIRHCPKLQTPEMLELFLASNPTAHDLYLAMINCGQVAQTPEMLELFLASNPTAHDLCLAMINCGQVAQTPEVMARFLAAKPTAEEISCVIRKCGDFAQTPELLAAFLAAKPTVHQVINIRKECEYARTPELRSLCCIRCSDPKTWRAHVCHC